MKIGDVVRIGDYDDYFKPKSKIDYSTYGGLSGEVLRMDKKYAHLYVPSKPLLYGKNPFTRVPKIQCEQQLGSEEKEAWKKEIEGLRKYFTGLAYT